MITHDPTEYIKGLQTILVSDKKKIGFLLGAGTSLAKKNFNSKVVPSVIEMTNNIIQSITDKKNKDAVNEIKDEIGDCKFNIETLLSKLELKFQAIGNSSLNGLDKNGIKSLIDEIKNKIKEIVSVHNDIQAENQIQTDFAEWIKRADRKFPIELFTTNYDYLFEIGLEYHNIPYFDGFSGSFNPFFCAELVNDFSFLPKQTKLWKIHGSLGWAYDESNRKVIRSLSENNNLLIYPSVLKYVDSKKLPYEALMDRLSNFIKQDDAVLITCGYSFGDEHINERIFTSLQSSATSSVLALLYEDNFNENHILEIAKSNGKLSVYAKKSAVIGCQYGIWKLKREPSKDYTISLNLYFDEDAPEMTSQLNEEKKGEEKWTGTGKLIITDFSKLVKFLQSMIV
ncbi:SIR2 family protein [Dissulfurispira thermophila]|uniref:SIR2 family protein n=1 Tax=Dissulfurispira thermophila TaxID=2715679 RepID=A0A7G1GYA5_9BACT|nr:SIR2 family protein [Dissulfurispira thermophila]BCB95420.1 SIR2 family protein [Dissulfurispira thermophila]